jgi:hypothetical protein
MKKILLFALACILAVPSACVFATNSTKHIDPSDYYWDEEFFNNSLHYKYANEILYADTYEEYFAMLDAFYPIRLPENATEYDKYKASIIQHDSLMAFECYTGITIHLFACEALSNSFVSFTNDKLSDVYRQTNYYSSDVDTAFNRYMRTMDAVIDSVVMGRGICWGTLGRLERYSLMGYLEECDLNSLLETLFYSEIDVPKHMTVTDEMIQSAFDMLRAYQITYKTNEGEWDECVGPLEIRLDMIHQDQAAWNDWMKARKVHESQLVGEAKKVYSNVTNNIKWRKLWLLKQMYECFGAHPCTFENYFLELECSDEELLNYDFYKVCNENDE